MKKLKTTLMLLLTMASMLGCLLSCMYTATLTARLDEVARSNRADMNYLRGCIRRLESELTQSVLNRLEEIARPQDTPDGGESSAENVWDPDSAVTTPDGESSQESIPSSDIPDSAPESIAVVLPEIYPEPSTESTCDTDTDTESESTMPETAAPAVDETRPASESETAVESETRIDEAAESESLELPTHNQTETLPPIPEPDPAPVLYTVAAHNGRIGVFDATGRLIREVNVFLFALPREDREALTVGIPAYSREEMLEIVKRYE